MSKSLLIGILNDIHFPYEERPRYSIAKKILKDIFDKYGLAHIYLNGDIGEFQGVSSFPVHPSEKKLTYMDEIVYLNTKFDELQKLFPDVPVTLIEGNHCYRMFRFIRDVAPQLWGLIDCPSLLKFPDRPKWKFVPYGPDQLVQALGSKLYLRHEPVGGGQNHAKTTAEKSWVDIAYGHTHTFQAYTHRKFGPTSILTKAYSLGWMGDKSRHVFDYRGSRDNWHVGFTIAEIYPTGDYTLDFLSLETLPVYYRGRKYDLCG